MDSSVYALTNYNSNLVAAGQFAMAGGKVSPYLAVWTKPTAIDISLDIKPGSCPNPLNGTDQSQGKAVLPVAVLGTANFDVHDIDPASITLNGISPLRWSYEDVSTPIDKSEDSCACTEEGPDGFEDLILKFNRKSIETALLSNSSEIDEESIIAKIIPNVNGNIHPTNPSDPITRESYSLIIQGKLNDGASFEGFDCVVLMTRIEGVVSRSLDTPTKPRLGGNFPNPFNPVTTIEYSMPSQTQVTIEIFNLLGQKIRTLVNESKSAGSYRAEWDGSDDTGQSVSTGIYLYRFRAGNVIQSKKMLLLK